MTGQRAHLKEQLAEKLWLEIVFGSDFLENEVSLPFQRKLTVFSDDDKIHTLK